MRGLTRLHDVTIIKVRVQEIKLSVHNSTGVRLVCCYLGNGKRTSATAQAIAQSSYLALLLLDLEPCFVLERCRHRWRRSPILTPPQLLLRLCPHAVASYSSFSLLISESGCDRTPTDRKFYRDQVFVSRTKVVPLRDEEELEVESGPEESSGPAPAVQGKFLS